MVVHDHAEHAIVGSDELIVAGVGGNPPARRSHAGIDHNKKNRAGWKVPVGGGQLERAGEHVVRRHLMGDVDERDVGTNPQNHPLHRPGVVIAHAEIGQERDHGAGHAASLSNFGFGLLAAGSWRRARGSGLQA